MGWITHTVFKLDGQDRKRPNSDFSIEAVMDASRLTLLIPIKEAILPKAHQKPSNFIHSFPNLSQIAATVCLPLSIGGTDIKSSQTKLWNCNGREGGGGGITRFRDDDFQPERRLRTQLAWRFTWSRIVLGIFGMTRRVLRGMRRRCLQEVAACDYRITRISCLNATTGKSCCADALVSNLKRCEIRRVLKFASNLTCPCWLHSSLQILWCSSKIQILKPFPYFCDLMNSLQL